MKPDEPLTKTVLQVAAVSGERLDLPVVIAANGLDEEACLDALDPAIVSRMLVVGADAGVEFGRILDEIRKASDALGGGALRETVVSLARFTLVLHSVDDDTFLVMALLPDGNLGKARYLLRRHLPAIRAAL